MCESQSEKAFNEKLAKSVKVATQYGVSERERERQILRIVATRCALVGFVLMMSRLVAIGLATVPGAHVDDVDSFAWFCLGLLALYVPIGFNCVLVAGGLLVARASLR